MQQRGHLEQLRLLWRRGLLRAGHPMRRCWRLPQLRSHCSLYSGHLVTKKIVIHGEQAARPIQQRQVARGDERPEVSGWQKRSARGTPLFTASDTICPRPVLGGPEPSLIPLQVPPVSKLVLRPTRRAHMRRATVHTQDHRRCHHAQPCGQEETGTAGHRSAHPYPHKCPRTRSCAHISTACPGRMRCSPIGGLDWGYSTATWLLVRYGHLQLNIGVMDREIDSRRLSLAKT